MEPGQAMEVTSEQLLNELVRQTSVEYAILMVVLLVGGIWLFEWGCKIVWKLFSRS